MGGIVSLVDIVVGKGRYVSFAARAFSLSSASTVELYEGGVDGWRNNQTTNALPDLARAAAAESNNGDALPCFGRGDMRRC